MYFKKLELIGFKSFYNKTTLEFEPGITAVVGPNGCGKSNIFDSIRWVLGEQSVKSLRGSAMEDVIFNGTDLKEPLSMAEVSLTFDNSNKFFPVEHSEVIITRRIFRSGESEYLLNKTQVRLKDILDLLLGTGIGAESYSLIPQGKIDMILSSKPEDRRLIFDEASGITKYKSQKKEAIRRLEETDQNLLRVNDIITEVKRQIGSLERQANKARRYKEVFDELKAKELTQATSQKKELEAQKNILINEINALQNKEAGLIEAIKKQDNLINASAAELKAIEEAVLSLKNEILNTDNLISRNNEHMEFNKKRILELGNDKNRLLEQVGLARSRLTVDEEKLNTLKQDYACLNQNIEQKTTLLRQNESALEATALKIKGSLEKISSAKKQTLDIITQITSAKNEQVGLNSKQQIFLARKKRLEIEKLKVNEEEAVSKTNLRTIEEEVRELENSFTAFLEKIAGIRLWLESEKASLDDINASILELEKQRMALLSQKEFLEELKTKYQDLGEPINAVIYLDKPPQEKISGLVIKIKEYLPESLKACGEAKPVDLDTSKINEKISSVEQELSRQKNAKSQKESTIKQSDDNLAGLQNEQHGKEITLANKKTTCQAILEQFNKIKDEEELILIELSDVEKELSEIAVKASAATNRLLELENGQKINEDAILGEQEKISANNAAKEGILVEIAQTKTELEAFTKRLSSDDKTVNTLEERFNQDKQGLSALEKQIEESLNRQDSLSREITELENDIAEAKINLIDLNNGLKEKEDKYLGTSESFEEITQKIDADKKELETSRSHLYELQMRQKDLEFKYLSIKDRLSQAYKIDLDILPETGLKETFENQGLGEEIRKLKEKLDSYGTVNLVAIEEYDELKKRYDFLSQQQADLVTAKNSLHEAIIKINRTTKKMFIETFEKIQGEFRTYFKLLFNGGDAQIYLIDEQDPLESGIEIICRPPGKKLQNVLLLSGGEKSMSAIALIFAIFKIKPAPFCVLDEIDAALDEANVDRFGRALQEFIKISQFIVITHNKKTIANADIMYGITMEESGISKIVSVKFAPHKSPSKNQGQTELTPIEN